VQNTTLMNGVNHLFIEKVNVIQSPISMNDKAPSLYRINMQMTDGALIKLDFERFFATRNLP
jgi:hypothetical protein